MIELSLLGLHALRGPDGRELTSLPAQPKRFALLAYLTLGGSSGYHRRDTLAAVFWPEMDQFAARRALRNTLYHLREALGDNVIVTRGDEAVSINPAMLTCDVTRVHEAFDAGRYEEVVDRCHGELLAGIHFANAGDAYEEWLARERAAMVALVMRALAALVEREQGAGNIAAAAHWAQRACTLDPRDEIWLRRAMSLLDEGNDTGSALHLYDNYASRLAAEFKAKPSAESAALAVAIRNGSRHAVAGAGPHAPTPDISAVEQVAPAAVARRGSGRRVAGWLVLAGALAAVVVVVAHAMGATQSRRTGSRTRVLVTPFDNRTGDSAFQSLGRMTQDWLAQGILRTNLVDVVDPRAVFVQSHPANGGTVDPIALAHRTGAAMVVSGSYYRAGDTLLFQASVMDVATGRIVRVVGPVRAGARSPVAALDELRSRVMTALASAVDVRVTENFAGSGEIPTFDAYQAYVEGSDAYWHGDRRRAEALFLQAAHRDTSFATAAIAAATTAGNVNDCAVIDSIAQALEARAQQLERVDRLSLQIAVARCRGRNEELLRLALERADLEPRVSAVQISAAAAALWADRPERALEMLKRVDPATDLAWSTDTTHFDYWSDLTEAYHRLGRHEEELAAADRVPRSAPLSRAWMRGRALAALSRPTAALAVIDSALTLPVEMANVGLAPFTDGRPQYTATPAWAATWIAHELAVHGDTVAARQAAQRAVAWYRGRSPEERSTVEERLVAAWSLEIVGAYAEARRLAQQLAAEDSSNVDYRGELAGLAAEQGDTALADTLDRWLGDQPVARVNWSATVYRARVAALLGRPEAAIARTREARDEGAWPLWIHIDSALVLLHPARPRSQPR